jgi:hypothetical protein
MVRRGFVILPIVLAVASVGLAPMVAVAGTVYSDSAVAAEISATSTRGVFVGTASGNLPGAWYAAVNHSPLSSGTVAITGGVFDLYTAQNFTPETLTGSFTGGTITPLALGANCTNQRYQIAGTLTAVSLGSQNRGTGTFAAVLTHYRTSIFGSCVTYFATIKPATISVTFS